MPQQHDFRSLYVLHTLCSHLHSLGLLTSRHSLSLKTDDRFHAPHVAPYLANNTATRGLALQENCYFLLSLRGKPLLLVHDLVVSHTPAAIHNSLSNSLPSKDAFSPIVPSFSLPSGSISGVRKPCLPASRNSSSSRGRERNSLGKKQDWGQWPSDQRAACALPKGATLFTTSQHLSLLNW